MIIPWEKKRKKTIKKKEKRKWNDEEKRRRNRQLSGETLMVCRFLSSLFETFHFLEKYYIFSYRSYHRHDDDDDGRKQGSEWYGRTVLNCGTTTPQSLQGGVGTRKCMTVRWR